MVVFVPFERARVRAVRVCTLPIIGAAGPFLELYWRPFGATALADFRWWWCYVVRCVVRPGHTRTYQTTYRSGLIGVLAGESAGKALARTIEQINQDGARVVFLVRDRWSIWQWLGALILFVLTVGLVGRTPGYVVITERREVSVAGATEADGGRRRLAGVVVMVSGRRQYVHAECVSADWPREDPAPRAETEPTCEVCGELVRFV